MIALPNDLPLIRLEDGDAIPFEPEWLTCSLSRAARRAGHAARGKPRPRGAGDLPVAGEQLPPGR